MLKVIRMDLILNRNAMLVNAGVFGAFFLYMVWRGPDRPFEFAVFCSLLVSFLPLPIVTREDKFKAMGLGCSLPVARRTIVLARYALAFGLAATGLLVVGIAAGWMPNSVMTPGLLFRAGPILAALSVSTIVLALLLPFTLRFGALGLMVALVGFQVLGIILFTVVRLRGPAVGGGLGKTIVMGIMGAHERLGPLGFDALLVFSLLVLLSASLAVSVWVFQRREL
ncbi:MAG: ABC-2 transporter permease [Gemmatimonadota bacterium]